MTDYEYYSSLPKSKLRHRLRKMRKRAKFTKSKTLQLKMLIIEQLLENDYARNYILEKKN